MTKKLWQSTTNLNTLVEQYTSGDDVLLDQNLVSFDIYGSLAHAQMLAKQSLIEESDLVNIKQGLIDILDLYKKGKYFLQLSDEDVHTRIENDLTKKYPESGAKLHTGRSRNDQVLVDIRLYTKVQLIDIALDALSLAEIFYQQADELSEIPLPGMTHMQPAMLSSFGLWLGSFAESLIDDLSLIESAYVLNNQSPLGSGAAYGVTLPIDREHTSQLLGFAKVQNNALYCQNSRGKIEAFVLHAFSQVMATLNKFATDSLLFTTEPFSFITFEKNLGTGSSIMPQKQNWDGLELMRAKYHQLIAAQLQLSTSLAGLPSGYNRDLQQAKGSLMAAVQTTLSSLKVAKLFVQTIKVDEEQIKKHLPKELFATHWAYVLVQEEKMPFRQAYMYVKEHLNEIPDFDVAQLLQQAVSQGSTGNLQLSVVLKNIQEKRRHWTQEKNNFEKIINKLIQK
ncbi:MAG: argininosuccinate lyase [Patescibacteria group bacterium]